MERIFVLLRSPGSATAVLLGATLIEIGRASCRERV